MNRFFAAIVSSATILGGCSVDVSSIDLNTVEGRPVKLSVGGFADSLALAPFQRAATDVVEGDYLGIGNSVGDAVVDGFRIRITAVEIMKSGAPQNGGQVGYWPEGMQLEVADGFEGEIVAEGVLPYGEYDAVRVTLQTNYDLKAWAYLDRDYDGTVDFTMWTTVDGIVTAASRIDSTADMAGYDYLRVPFLYGGQTGELAGEQTPLGETLVVSEDGDNTPLKVDIRLDTYRVAKAWDGDEGGRASTFAWDNDRYTAGEPHFGIGYLPLFALVDEPNAVAETYLFSGDVTFSADALQLGTILFRGDGSPVIGRLRDVGLGYDSLHLNQFIGVFEGTNDDFSFYGGDGDILYFGDITNHQEKVTGFKRLGLDDEPVEITVIAGPACDQCEPERTGYLKRVAR